MPRSCPTAALRHHRPVAGAAVAAAVVLLALLLPPLAPSPAGGQEAAVHSPTPAPHAVVPPGALPVGAAVEGGAGAVLVDGEPAEGPAGTDALGRTLVEVELPPGRHQVGIAVGGQVVREWPVVVADLPVAAVPADAPATARTAAGPAGPPVAPRPALLVNPDRPELAVAAGPLAAATGAVLVPVPQDHLPEAASQEIRRVAGDDGRVLLLGGLDAVGPQVEQAVADAGHDVRRIGSGSAAEVAAAAAAAAPDLPTYRRRGGPRPRAVVVAPAEPLASAVQAAALAAQRGASLLLADGGALPDAAAGVVAARDLVLLAPDLPAAARDAVREAAAPHADVAGAPRLPPAADRLWVVDAANRPDLAVLATAAAGPSTAVITDLAAAEQRVHADPPARAVAVGGSAAAATVAGWSVDGPDAPDVDVELHPDGTGGGSAPALTLEAGAAPTASAVHVTVHGREWPGTTTVRGSTVSWQAGPRPPLPAALEPAGPVGAPLVVTAVVAVDGRERHVALESVVRIGPLATTSPEGYRVAAGSSAVAGSAGPLRTFTVEVEPATGLDLHAVTEEVTAILLDPERGWTARGERRLQRIGDPAAADIRVLVATPATVDANCARVGLDTGGRLSCWDGRRANLNLDRWTGGVAPFHTDLSVYRPYLVSHEVGHGLGYGHVGCPGAGHLAPVMMQQSKGLGGCRANGWPYP